MCSSRSRHQNTAHPNYSACMLPGRYICHTPITACIFRLIRAEANKICACATKGQRKLRVFTA